MSRFQWRWTNVPVPEPHVVALGGAAIGHVIAPARVPIGPRIAWLLGAPTLGAGIALAAWAVASASTDGVEVDRPTGLVTSGAFAVSRNPMYQGWTIAVIGLAVIARSPWLLAAAAIASAAAHREVLDEEISLSKAFGRRYRAYSSATPRYLSAGAIADVIRMVRGGTVIDGRRS